MGNIRYRVVVQKAAQDCKNYETLSGAKKRELAVEVVAIIKGRGGRFMKKQASAPLTRGRGKQGNGGRTTKRYMEVSDAVAIEKVKQGFRHQIKSAAYSLKKPDTRKSCQLGTFQKVETTSKKHKHSDPLLGAEEATRTAAATLFDARKEFCLAESDKLHPRGTSHVKHSRRPSSGDRYSVVGTTRPNTSLEAIMLAQTLFVPPKLEGSCLNTMELLDLFYPGLPSTHLFPPNYLSWPVSLLSKTEAPTMPPLFIGETPNLLRYSHSLRQRSLLPDVTGKGAIAEWWDANLLEILAALVSTKPSW